ncbi:MAG: hypothetical protein K2L87_00430 [Clostridiales bacterium]|nr:hypothetical protein [Clostridiales bacterium]
MLVGTVGGLAACGETAHTHDLSAVAKKDATCTEAGYEAYYKCSGCDKIFSDDKGETEITAPAAIVAKHTIEAVAKKDATCTEAGYEAYYECSACDKIFSDDKGETEITAPEAIAASHTIEAVAKVDATCTAEGTAAHYQCTVCNTLFSDEEGKNTITAAEKLPVAAHTIVEVSKKRPTCTEAGYEEHYQCSVCNTLFSDEEGKTVIEAETLVIPAEHRTVTIAKKDATCAEAGYEEYYQCSICEKLFSDKEGTTEIAAPVVIPQSTEHTFGFAYTDETVPEAVAEGGTLDAKCVICGHDMGTVDYDAGVTIPKTTVENGAQLEGAGTYYYQLNAEQRVDSYFGFYAETAGTYTLTFTNVYSDENVVRYLYGLWILADGYPEYEFDWLIIGGSWDPDYEGEIVTEEDAARYQSAIQTDGFVDGEMTTLNSITFTFTEEDVADGGLYIMFNLNDRDMSDGTGKTPEHAGTFLIEFEITEA